MWCPAVFYRGPYGCVSKRRREQGISWKSEAADRAVSGSLDQCLPFFCFSRCLNAIPFLYRNRNCGIAEAELLKHGVL